MSALITLNLSRFPVAGETIADAIRRAAKPGTVHEMVFQSIADQIDAQVRKAVAQPTLYGVVRAHTKDDERRRTFVRFNSFVTNGKAWRDGAGEPWRWDDLVDPEILREGA